MSDQLTHARKQTARLSPESLLKLRQLFFEQAEKGSTIFHQAHAEELLAMADELLERRDRDTASKMPPMMPHRCIFRSTLADVCRPLLKVDAKDPLRCVQDAVLAVKESSAIVSMALETRTETEEPR